MTKRIDALDYIRGFIFALLVLDHSAHCYGQIWGKYHFFMGSQRSIIGDILYLHNNNIIMPMLFFIIGATTIFSINKRGYIEHLKHCLLRYCLVFIIFIPLLLPLLCYPKFVINNPDISYWVYWSQYFFTKYLQAGPMWVMFALFLLSSITMLLHAYPRFLWRGWLYLMKPLAKNVMAMVIIFAMVFSLIFSVSELLFGPYHWLSYFKLFALQGSKFGVQCLAFFMGAALAQLGYLSDEKWLARLINLRYVFLIAASASGVLYINYALSYHWEAYSYDVVRHVLAGGNYNDIPGIISGIYPPIVTRCLLQGTFLILQMFTILSMFFHFFHKKTNYMWGILAANGYAIFLFHEGITIWLQYLSDTLDWINPFVKIIIIFALSLGSGLLLAIKLRKIGIIRKVIG